MKKKKHCKHHGLTDHSVESRNKPDKNGYTHPPYYRCLKCRSEGNIKKRIKRNMFSCILLEKHGATCTCCGYNEQPEILQWHHTDPDTKLFHISEAISRMGKIYTPEAIEVEAMKCVLLCPNCHAKEHTKYSYVNLMEKVAGLPPA